MTEGMDAIVRGYLPTQVVQADLDTKPSKQDLLQQGKATDAFMERLLSQLRFPRTLVKRAVLKLL